MRSWVLAIWVLGLQPCVLTTSRHPVLDFYCVFLHLLHVFLHIHDDMMWGSEDKFAVVIFPLCHVPSGDQTWELSGLVSCFVLSFLWQSFFGVLCVDFNSQSSSFLCLPSAGIQGVYYHTRLLSCWTSTFACWSRYLLGLSSGDWTQGIMHTKHSCLDYTSSQAQDEL